MEVLASSLLNGLTYGFLLFMLASGLTLIFSLMGIMNFAHASIYMLGAYVGYALAKHLGFWVGALVAPALVGILGCALERWFLRALHARGHVVELLFTFGLALLIEEVVKLIWVLDRLTTTFRMLSKAACLSCSEHRTRHTRVLW
jgi:branched-chain amino acid transport system permease protein